ncbi:MAG: hypothetical protein Hyperionvirus23_12 [Hyperionvirus sp.]|uniref:chitin synthase n=1 Tax=Hyperionvirus sp. TaxID=2487770 RepID=A0A3G5AAU1_9VIRU|nr:MAG: hypothetical protein Hyperionvirus23_12 [Hyperionvirus sp.]
MQCIECKSEILPQHSFCQECGAKISEILEPSPSDSEHKFRLDFMGASPQRPNSAKSPREFPSFVRAAVLGAAAPPATPGIPDLANVVNVPKFISHNQDPTYNKTYEHTICKEFRGQSHFRPDPNTKYWCEDKQAIPPPVANGVAINVKKSEKMLTILVPFYNEESSELMMTLDSLYPDFASIKAMGFDVHILLVMDGWWKASESMKKFMCTIFKNENSNAPGWWNAIKPIGADDDLAECVGTFVVQRLAAGGESIAPVHIGDKSMKISLLVKRDNRRKINAHDWMLSSFAEFYGADFVFLTDCGTLFEKKCLTLLTRELLKRPDCTAVSGRQRVMSAEQQGSDECPWLSYGSLLRGAQRFDYESSLASFVGAFSLFGMLPVIPGPCGLYRYAAIKKECVSYYINAVAAHPSECGILMANLNLAEDRVLSYAAVLKTGKDAYTAYVPESIFFFAAETSPLQLFQQRRRWINGTIAGYIWLLSKPSLIWDSGLKWWNKPLLSLLLVCQLFMYIGVAVSPGIFITSLYWSSLWIDDTFLGGHLERFSLCEVFFSFYLLVYVAFALRHANPANKPAVSEPFVKFVTFVNMVAMTSIMVSMGSSLKIMFGAGGDIWWMTSNWDLDYVVTLLVVFTIFGPLLLALMHSPTSFYYMLRSFGQFYLLLPTMVTYVGVYSLSRVWDLSWGNRPSEKSSLKATLSAEEQKKNASKIQRTGRRIAYGLIAVNGLVTFLLLESKERRVYVLALAIFIFAWSNIQMLLSSVYFIGRNTRRILRVGSRWCCVKMCKCYTKKEWYTGTKN